MDYDDILAMTQSRANLLARCIMFGIAEPGGDMNADVALAVASALAEELPVFNDDPAVLTTYDRALAFAAQDKVSPEAAILIAMAVRARTGLPRLLPAGYPGRDAFLTRLDPILDTLS